MKHLSLFKYTGTGNDFLILDFRKADVPIPDRSKFARTYCRRRFGVGADGLVVLEPDAQLDFKWDFYNSDGSVAEMCGNAARCVALHIFRTEQKREIRFRTLAGEISAHYKNEEKIDVTMTPIKTAKWNQLCTLKEQQLHYDFIVSGVPHAVVKTPNFKSRERLKAWAREIKSQPIFHPTSTNVTFVRQVSKNKAQSMSFERGVENFTLSCGTGAVAAAYSLLRGEENSPIQIQVPGGRLEVVFKKNRPHLIGPANFIGEIKINPDLIKD